MFIDYITLMLINMVSGLVLLAHYVYTGLEHSNPKRWIPGFGITGAIALVTGLHMTLTWPVSGSFNIAFGETSVLFGGLFVGAAIALSQNWELTTLAIYSLFAGFVSIVVGARVISLGLTNQPIVSGLGFLLTGFAGVCALPTLLYFKQNRAWRTFGAIVLLAAAVIWAMIGYQAYWMHLEGFQKWVPAPMR
jgi:putative membrane protein